MNAVIDLKEDFFQWRKSIMLLVGLALAIRLAYVFFVTPLVFDWDSYHHWQISYYTLHIGLQYGRMWDLSGMEYFWGIFPEFVQLFLLWLFRTSSILPFRILNGIVGALSCYVVYLIGLKYYGGRPALISSLLVALNPVLIAWNATGVNEPLGIFFLLLSLLAYERRPYLSGVSLGLASICRTEYLFLAIGICVAYLVFEKSTTDFVPSIAGLFTVIGSCFYFLWSKTGDPLYSLRWNYFASVGVWQWSPGPGSPIPWRTLWGGILALSAYSLLRLYRHKPRGYIVSACFLGLLVFQGVLSTTTLRYVPWPWTYSWLFSPWRSLNPFDRPWMLDYVFLAFLLGRVASRGENILWASLYKRKASGPRGESTSYPVLGIVLLLLLLAWQMWAIPAYHQVSTSPTFGMKFWFKIADDTYGSYTGGSILVDPGNPQIVYRLVERGVPYRSVLTTFYAPSDSRADSLGWFRSQNATWYIRIPSYGKIFSELDTPGDYPPFYFHSQSGMVVVYKVIFRPT